LYYNNTAIDEKTLTKDVEVVNQTRKYLIPQFKHYGINLIDKIRNLNIKGTFLQDYGVNVSPESRKILPRVYFLFDVNGALTYGHYHDIKKARLEFMQALQYFRSQDYYEIDYPFDSNKDGHLHVVVLRLPEPSTLSYFLNGEYSKMYTDEQIRDWIPEKIKVIEDGKEVEKYTNAYQVLTRVPQYFEIFQQKVVEEFGSRESSVNPKAEYDFPPYLPNEILRYN